MATNIEAYSRPITPLPDNDQFARDFVHLKKLVAGDNFLAVKRNVVGMGGPRAAGDQNVIGVKHVRFRRALHFDGIGSRNWATPQSKSIPLRRN
jgi:hypothetical protein